MHEGFRPKAVLMDVDGTLLRKEYDGMVAMPSRVNTQAVRRVGLEVPTGLVTARQPQKSLPIAKHLDLSGFSVMSNGAQIWHEKSKKMVLERPLDRDITVSIARRLSSENLPFWIQDDGIDYIVGGNTEDLEPRPLREFTTFTNYVPYKPFVIVASMVTADIIAELGGMAQKYEHTKATTAHRHPDGTYDVFVTDERSDKLTAIKEVARMLDIDMKDMMAIGDGLNDLIYMNQCFGVAMGNAQPEVKARAKHITGSVNRAGVAQALDRFFPKRDH